MYTFLRCDVGSRCAWLAMAALLLAMAPAAADDTWPQRPIVMTVIGGPGTPPDVVARQLADAIGAALGQTIVIENQGAGGGIVGMDQVRRAPADGYRFVLSHVSALLINPALFNTLPYDPVRDFEPVSLLFEGPMVLVAAPSTGIASIEDLVRRARADSTRLFFGSSGVATPSHVFFEQFKAAAGIAVDVVPFKGAPGMAQALDSGEVGLAMESYAALQTLIEARKAKPLAVSGERRLDALPEVATFAQLGIAEIGVSWLAVLAPKGTPPTIVARMRDELARALAQPQLRRSYEALGRRIVASTPQELATRIATELPRWHDVVQRAGIRIQ